MTPSQEDMALRSCHPMYNEWCNEDEAKESDQGRIDYLIAKERVASLDKEERYELEQLLEEEE